MSVSEITAPRGDDSYFGGKGSCFRHLINQIPPHNSLVIPFAGHCAIARNIRPSRALCLFDRDPDVVGWWRKRIPGMTEWPYVAIFEECGIELIECESRKHDPQVIEQLFFYADPPYQLQTRKSGPRYRCEMSDAEHRRLTDALNELKTPAMVSGYDNPLYRKELKRWRSFSFQNQTRRGTVTETAWCNYPEPEELHDYRFLGKNKRERFKLARRENNLIDKLRRLPAIERSALLAATVTAFGVPRVEPVSVPVAADSEKRAPAATRKGVTHR